jgi:crossover junction endodeoxyribonuclease RuvC
MAITGNGNSSKEQVAKMLKSMLKIKELPKNLDSTDGLAAAVCHFFNFDNDDKKKKKYSNWSSFIDKNPEKLS